MKFVVNAARFREVFDTVSRLAPKLTPKPCLQSVLLEASVAGATLATTNLEVYARVDLPGLEVDGFGKVLLPRDEVKAILAGSGAAELTFHSDAGTLYIGGGGGEFELQTEDPEEFPAFPELPTGEVPGVTVKAYDLAFLAKRVARASDPVLGGSSNQYGAACVEWDATTFALACFDDRRFARQEVAATTRGRCLPQRWLIPRKALELLPGFFDAGEVELLFPDHRAIHAVAPGIHVVARLAEGRFPDWRKFPESAVTPLHEAPVDVAAMESALARVAPMMGEETNAVTLEFATESLTISGRKIGRGRSKVVVPIQFAGPPTRVQVQCRFLVDAFKGIGSGIPVNLGCRSPQHPVYLRTDGHIHSVMSCKQGE